MWREHTAARNPAVAKNESALTFRANERSEGMYTDEEKLALIRNAVVERYYPTTAEMLCEFIDALAKRRPDEAPQV